MSPCHPASPGAGTETRKDEMINYATEPANAEVYGADGGLDELMTDAWLMAQPPETPIVGIDWTDDKQLSSITRSLLLVFEQGRNAPPFVFALTSNPTVDLAAEGFGVGGLHYLADDPDDEHYPPALREFYRPVAEKIQTLLDAIASAEIPDGPAHDELLRESGYRVVETFFARVAELGILRAQDFDEETGRATGMDRDIAPALPSAWSAYLARREQ